MKACMYARQNFNVDGFVFQDSFAVGEIDNTDSLSVENRGVRGIWKADFGFNVDGSPTFPSYRHKSKSADSVVMMASMNFPIHVVVNLATAVICVERDGIFVEWDTPSKNMTAPRVREGHQPRGGIHARRKTAAKLRLPRELLEL